MTTTHQTPTTPTSIGQAPQTGPAQGFQAIPTRIRDNRDGQLPPLVVAPTSDANKAAVCESLAELGARLAEIHRTAAEAFLSQGLYEQAMPHLEAATTFSPTEIEFRMQLGFVQYVCGDDAGAIKTFNEVITAEEDNGEAWFNLGMVVFGQQQFTEAEYCFRRASELEGGDAQTWNNRGVCLWQLDRIEEARSCFENALKIDPRDEDAQFNLQHLG